MRLTPIISDLLSFQRTLAAKRLLLALVVAFAGECLLVAKEKSAHSTGVDKVESAKLVVGVDCVVRPCDEMWVVSTRRLCNTGRQVDGPRLDTKRYDCEQNRWVQEPVSDLTRTIPDKRKPITLIYIHGNRTDFSTSISQARTFYRRLMNLPGVCRPVRFVIWSWPSDAIRGPLRDIRTKAARTHCDMYYLGWLLSRIEAEMPISLVGYSYGARIVLGGLHLSVGGHEGGRQLSIPSDQPISRVRVVLLAAAEHNYWLMPGHRHDEACSRINAMLNLYNSCDPALAHYKFVDSHAKPAAMGFTGVAGRSQIEDGDHRIRQFDVCGAIGKTHSAQAYFSSSYLVRKMQRYVLWESVH